MTHDYLEQLTPQQRAAVEHLDGAALVLAGPGSGKTRVITYRIIHLIRSHHISPRNIVAITFTNKAANEMMERAKQVLPKSATEMLHISTFHSFCARLLRYEHEAAGLVKNYTICDDSDTKAYITQSIALEIGKDPKKVRGLKDYRAPDKVQRFISKQKQQLQLPDDVHDALPSKADEEALFYAKVYSRYAATLTKARCLDFDDLIMKTVLLLRANEAVREKYSKRIQYLLVDESQDTNLSQYELVKHLGSYWRNVFMVGDADQSIYRFRGAQPENMAALGRDYENSKTYFLEDNFRSTNQIAEVANELIGCNEGRQPKVIKARVDGDKVKCLECLDNKQEAAVVVDQILGEVRREKAKWSDYAILYRMHTRSRIFEELMVTNNVPHQIIGGLGFYNRSIVKDIIAYLKFLLNGADDASFIRIYNKPPRGFGETSYAKLYHLKEERECHILTVFKKRYYEEVLKGKSLRGAETIRAVMLALHQMSQDFVAPLIEKVIEVTRYRQILEVDADAKSFAKLDHLDELIQAAKEFDEAHGNGLLRFIEWTALMQTTDKDTSKDCVHLMTCHAAKGLEFPRLYVIGAIDGVMPIVRDIDDFGRIKSAEQMQQDIEEERRVFFVALTRAERHLTITHTQGEMRYNSAVECTPSRFLTELGDNVDHEVLAGTSAGSYLIGALNRKRASSGQRKKKSGYTYKPGRKNSRY